jgi:UDP-N-acetylmuramyl pentapeptide phosphotransferase/UDP-N-acetylglucosamine-1-phosphate transferase
VAVSDSWGVITTALLVALSANLFNLLDVAPGRAGKVGVALWAPLLVWGSEEWAVSSAGVIGALLACLPLDLRERAMLGDAGANPLGGILGLGLALALPQWAGALAAVLMLGLNLSSELWSFSAIIERIAPLRALDRLGRVDPPHP